MPSIGTMPDFSGLILLDKPAGITCARIVNRIKPLLPPGTKLGHAGTLDSFATGLLILLAGRATRCCEQLMSMPKRYEATIRLGAVTATDDPQSPEEPFAGGAAPQTAPTREQIESVLAGMTGSVLQQPPAYSALKIQGKRASDRVRAGHAVELAARRVRIDALQVTSYEWPHVRLRVDCGRGTYVRAIARDLGRVLGVGGYLTQLSRTRIGPFELSDAQPLDALLSGAVTPRLIDPAISLQPASPAR
jgi:tRNA pseudouridine55 synthase